MSCFVRIATRLTDETTLRQAAEALGYPVRQETTQVRGWSGDTERADVVLDTGTDYDVGAIRQKDGTFELVSDWSMARLNQDDFVRRMTQKYSYLQVLEVARRKGFIVAKEEAQEQGAVRLVLRKFV